MMEKYGKVLVLMGGWSNERERYPLYQEALYMIL